MRGWFIAGDLCRRSGAKGRTSQAYCCVLSRQKERLCHGDGGDDGDNDSVNDGIRCNPDIRRTDHIDQIDYLDPNLPL